MISTTSLDGRRISWTVILISFYIMFAPLASGMRGLSVNVGNILLFMADISLLISFVYSSFKKDNFPAHFACILALYSLLIPITLGHYSVESFYLGIRKGLFFIIAIAIGYSFSSSETRSILRLIRICLFILCVYGIKQSFSMSQFDLALISAQGSADYTNSIGGRMRAISLLSSGFHLGMAGCTLIALSIYKDRISYRDLLPVLIAFLAINASITRTFMLVGIIIVIIRFIPLRSIYLLTYLLVATLITAVMTIYNYSLLNEISQFLLADDRFANRSYSYINFSEFRSMNGLSSVMGFGPGSAGSTMQKYFAEYSWIEPHSIFLKFIFEYGTIFGSIIIAYLAVFIPLASYFNINTSIKYNRRFGLALSLIILISGVTITSVEAAPISIYIALILGACLKRSKVPDLT